MKEKFLIVAAIKSQSGFKWDDEKGADIGPENEAVWKEYVKVCSMILLRIFEAHCSLYRHTIDQHHSETRDGLGTTKCCLLCQLHLVDQIYIGHCLSHKLLQLMNLTKVMKHSPRLYLVG